MIHSQFARGSGVLMNLFSQTILLTMTNNSIGPTDCQVDSLITGSGWVSLVSRWDLYCVCPIRVDVRFRGDLEGGGDLLSTPISGGSRIFPRGGANSQKCYYFSIFCRKLHENERIWTPRGGGGRASLAPPLDPPMPIYKSTNHRHCHRGKVREADTCTTPGVRMSLLISYRLHTQNWMLYLSVFVLGAPCDKSLPSIPGMFKLLRLGIPPGPIHTCLYKFV